MHGGVRITSIAILLACPAARADPDGRARAAALYERGALSSALAAYEDALRAGGDDREGLVEIYLHVGILRAGSRDPEGAQAAFLALLDLDPTRRPPAGSSPLVTAPFERALERRGEAPALRLAVAAPRSVAIGSAVELRARCLGDEAGLAAGVRAVLVGRNGGTSVVTHGAPPFTLVFPPGATDRAGDLQVRAELLDEFGSVLDTAGAGADERILRVVDPTFAGAPSRRARSRQPARRISPARTDDHGSALASPWLWGGVVVIVGTAVAAALIGNAGEDRPHFGPVEVALP
ncbi:MAG: hypothetical protein HYY06_16430 [Deltaproteobacteria bacterium]|nr:hypothetical protein [Deltaproteobacteria bacterium]